MAADLGELAPAGCVIEAVAEDLAVKQALFAGLEKIVTPDCVLATNTSSLSPTAIAAGLSHPGRLVGLHFFNPAPVMRLVEVVSGLATDPAVAAIDGVSNRGGADVATARAGKGALASSGGEATAGAGVAATGGTMTGACAMARDLWAAGAAA